MMKHEPITPSRVLEEYDILNDDISLELIEEMRDKFAELEMEGVHVWKMLCDEVSLPEELEEMEDVEKKIAEDRAWVAGACAEVMLEKVGHVNTADKIRWNEKIEALVFKEDFTRFFYVIELDSEEWWNGGRFSRKNQALYKAIIQDERFAENGWKGFLEFMEVGPRNWIEKVAACITGADFMQLFEQEGIKPEEWQSSGLLQKAKRGLYRAIVQDKRFAKDGWKGFLDFMKIDAIKRQWKRSVAECKTQEEFLRLFEQEKLIRGRWWSTEWLKKNGGNKLYEAISRDPRFTSWKHFIACMDGKLPFDGIQSPEEARKSLDAEILRLKVQKGWKFDVENDGKITQKEYDMALNPEFYKSNVVIRIVAEFLHSTHA